MRRIARPSSTIDRPARRPASASVFSRATFEAKVVATTRPLDPATSLSISAPTLASDRPGCAEKTLVESQISALHAILGRLRPRAGIERLAHHRRGVELEVAACMDPPRRRLDPEPGAFRDRMRDRQEGEPERAGIEGLGKGRDRLERLRDRARPPPSSAARDAR
jgi:hypothetical protein